MNVEFDKYQTAVIKKWLDDNWPGDYDNHAAILVYRGGDDRTVTFEMVDEPVPDLSVPTNSSILENEEALTYTYELREMLDWYDEYKNQIGYVFSIYTENEAQFAILNDAEHEHLEATDLGLKKARSV